MLDMLKVVLLLSVVSAGYWQSARCSSVQGVDGEDVDVAASQSWFSPSVQDGYKKVEEYLQKSVSTDDIQANMNEISELLAKKSHDVIKKKHTIKALKQLASLSEIKDDNKCNKRSYEILVSNNFGTDGAALMENPTRRVDIIVHHFAQQHAQDCKDSYEPKLTAKYNELGVTELDNYLRNNLIYLDFHSPYELPPIQDRQNEGIVKLKLPKGYYELLKLCANDPDVKYLYIVKDENPLYKVDSEKVVQLFDRHVVEPCKKYMSQVEDIALPAMFDLQKDGPEKVYSLRPLNLFSNCDVVVHFQRGYMFKDLVQKIWRCDLSRGEVPEDPVDNSVANSVEKLADPLLPYDPDYMFHLPD